MKNKPKKEAIPIKEIDLNISEVNLVIGDISLSCFGGLTLAKNTMLELLASPDIKDYLKNYTTDKKMKEVSYCE